MHDGDDDTAVLTLRGAHRQLDFPDANSAVTSVLLENAGLTVCQSHRQLLGHLFHTVIELRIASPPYITRSVQNFFRPQLQYDVGMRADKNPCGGYLAKH